MQCLALLRNGFGRQCAYVLHAVVELYLVLFVVHDPGLSFLLPIRTVNVGANIK